MTRAGYYAFLKRRKSKTQIEREALQSFVADIFEEHKGRYGARRIKHQLASIGIHVSRTRVSRTMNVLELRAKGRKKGYRMKGKLIPYDEKSNLLNQVFIATEKNRIWVGDITYVPTRKGFLYLAVLIDVFSRKVVGWSMSTLINQNLVTACLRQALGRERPSPGLIVHTDRGSQYTSKAFQRELRGHGIIASMSRKGNPYDNAVMESFYKTLKREVVNGANYRSQMQAEQEIFKYIELYYNTKRIHSTLGYVSPVQYELENAM